MVPDVVGLEWDTARRVLASARLGGGGRRPGRPPLPALATGGRIVVEQKPGAGEQRGAAVGGRLWLGRGPGDAGVREPLHPRPSPRATGGAIDETTGKAVP